MLYCAHSPVSRTFSADADTQAPEGYAWHNARGHHDASRFGGNNQREAWTAARKAGWHSTGDDVLCHHCAADLKTSSGKKTTKPASPTVLEKLATFVKERNATKKAEAARAKVLNGPQVTIRGSLVIGGTGEPSGATVTSTHKVKPPFPW